MYPVRPLVCRRAYPGTTLRSFTPQSKSSSFPAASVCGDSEQAEGRPGLRWSRAAQPLAAGPGAALCRPSPLAAASGAAVSAVAIGGGEHGGHGRLLAGERAGGRRGRGRARAGPGAARRGSVLPAHVRPQPPRSCEDYWGEWKHCRGLRHAFHHYYAHGELPDCGRWREDYEACRAWERDRAAAAQVPAPLRSRPARGSFGRGCRAWGGFGKAGTGGGRLS